MLFRKGSILSVFIFTVAVLLLPAFSFAILSEDDNSNRESPYPSFLVDINATETIVMPGRPDRTSTTGGTGVFIAPNLVVTAAHVVAPTTYPLTGTEVVISDITVSGLSRGAREIPRERFVANVVDTVLSLGYNTAHAGEGNNARDDLAVLVLDRPLDVEVLRLPEEVGVTVAEHEELVGTLFGQMVADRAIIAEAYDGLFNADGSYTAFGMSELVQSPESDRNRQLMPSRIVLAGGRVNHDRTFAPFVRMRIPRPPLRLPGGWSRMSAPGALAGFSSEDFQLNFLMNREAFINDAYAAARRSPFHQGDSGSPFIARSPGGELYLAGVAQSITNSIAPNDDRIIFPVISTGSVVEILEIMELWDEDGMLRTGENVRFWRDPNGNVPTLENWNDDNGLVLAEIPEAGPSDEPISACEFSHSELCNYLNSVIEPDREYNVRALSMQIFAPEALVRPYDWDPRVSEYRVYGQLVYFSPGDYSYSSTTPNPIDDPVGSVFNFNNSAPWRVVVPYRHEGDPVTAIVPRPDSVQVQASSDAPMICLATPSGSGVFLRTVERSHAVIPEGNRTCILADEATMNENGTYDVPIEGVGGTITVELQIEPSTAL
ncbi:hypothetical protein ACEK07_04955 [Alcanivoracaceae bacterium MT1]